MHFSYEKQNKISYYHTYYPYDKPQFQHIVLFYQSRRISKKPNNTFSLLRPNGRIRFFASRTSNPDLVAAIAKKKPPKKSIITGLAKVAIISLLLSSFPNASFSSPLKKNKLWLETVKHIRVMIPSEVAHEGIASLIHIRVANTKIAIIRW